MITIIRCILLIFCFTAFRAKAQYYFKKDAKPPTESDKISMGLGLGLDYGGIGANFLVYPQKNIGIFAGGGYAIAGFGYNVGTKIRITSASKVQTYVTAMYGYNTAIYVTNATQHNKIFYGVSPGFGIDLRTKPNRYFSFAILVPVRGSDVDDYINTLKGYGVALESSLPPIGISVGYRFVLE